MTEMDLRGLRCPLPVLRARKRLGAMAPGERLRLLSDDPLAPMDLAHLCRQEGHRLAADEAFGTHHRFEIVKGGGNAP